MINQTMSRGTMKGSKTHIAGGHISSSHVETQVHNSEVNMCASGYYSSAAEAFTAPANVSRTQRKTLSRKG